ncbi:COX15/CtaA family protein [Streptomyces sp. S07_1.15]|uniref:COX15/CtaA family protein n=1 Tax=Streptomyces sp. S07_1.15 TaxID=2873925 RepID=UPI001D1580B3|nr:COX15/CtaA family protein [Streptomyces sp. S07_1.15]MCC3654776.1 COX15/CtaA family protein [Streptomyces sp. S07_1.15]
MSKPTAIVPNPLAAIAARWTPSPRTVRLAALAALLMSIVIIVTGGAVRLTGSGLGCDTWPKCSGDSLIATREMGLHGAIEFGNRMLTYVLTAAVGWTIIAARSAEPRRRSLTRLGWLQFFVVLANAVLGGITVLLELNPYIVAGHFLAATALLTVTAVTWERTREGDGAPRPLAGPRVRALAWALAAVTALLVIAGTVVTGAGPHAGDSSEVPRMGVDWETVTRVHALLAWAVVLLTAALWVVLRAVDAPAAPRRRTALLMAVLLAQGAIGYAQYLTDLPEVLVGLHMLGSCLVWVGVIRVLLSLRERPAVAAEPPVPPAPRQGGPAVAAAL